MNPLNLSPLIPFSCWALDPQDRLEKNLPLRIQYVCRRVSLEAIPSPTPLDTEKYQDKTLYNSYLYLCISIGMGFPHTIVKK